MTKTKKKPFFRPARVCHRVSRSLQDGIERQLTPPTPPPRRNLPPAAATITFATTDPNDSSSDTTTSLSPSPSPSFGSSSNGAACYYSYPSRGCCVDFVAWSHQHGTIIHSRRDRYNPLSITASRPKNRFKKNFFFYVLTRIRFYEQNEPSIIWTVMPS